MDMDEPEKIEMSPETLRRIKEEFEEKTTTGRLEMAERLQRAREMGDLKENSEYHSAKNDQGMMEARIRQLEHMIHNAVVRQERESDGEAVSGTIVSVRDGDDVDEYLLTNSSEEKLPGIRTVTASSPLGAALIGRKVGEKVTVQAPAGEFEVEIVAVRSA